MRAIRQGRRSFLAASAALTLPGLLGACGFQPLYGDFGGDDVKPELAAVAVIVPHGRLGQSVKAALAADLNPAGISVPPEYFLSVSLGRTTRALAIQLNSTITRYDLILDATFALSRNADNATVYRNRVRRIASYNVSQAPYSTQVAEEDAERRAAVEVSRQIATLLAVFFRDQKVRLDEPAS
ncbi:MAG TPA: LPS assembly lipoprotein LptE [Geminicoccus sp.]|jgi:LPS-assembly lipoprotein|uniref:LPS assembly lipoprotein LptE n=1 Tax=Geminicoccus sp. TaxID=2024832 RepID=UPI002E31BCD0|nr:LPS assembly lipoprotein LptE [Geminicoccus sp.]HEX2529319.1 LPS assembly lipoprotein LptE [Geminicoccus sp.]